MSEDGTATTSTDQTAETMSSKEKRKHKVIIVGAGMAGLSSANHLAKNGCTDFLILEGRNRVGGRIVSIDMGSQKVSRKMRRPPTVNTSARERHGMWSGG